MTVGILSIPDSSLPHNWRCVSWFKCFSVSTILSVVFVIVWAYESDRRLLWLEKETHNNKLNKRSQMTASTGWKHLPESRPGVWVLRGVFTVTHSCPTSSSVSESQLGNTFQEFWQTFWKGYSDHIHRGKISRLRRRIVNKTSSNSGYEATHSK